MTKIKWAKENTGYYFIKYPQLPVVEYWEKPSKKYTIFILKSMIELLENRGKQCG